MYDAASASSPGAVTHTGFTSQPQGKSLSQYIENGFQTLALRPTRAGIATRQKTNGVSSVVTQLLLRDGTEVAHEVKEAGPLELRAEHQRSGCRGVPRVCSVNQMVISTCMWKIPERKRKGSTGPQRTPPGPSQARYEPEGQSHQLQNGHAECGGREVNPRPNVVLVLLKSV